MAFRPGIVDLTEDQAAATTGALNLQENFNEVDILQEIDFNEQLFARSSVSGTPKSNTRNIQDITLQQSPSNYLSFSQNLLDDNDIGLDNIDRNSNDISMEVGRDAPGSAQRFRPDDSLLRGREKSVQPEDPLLTQDPSFDLGLDGNDQSLGFNFNDDFGVGEFNVPEDFGPVPIDFEVPFNDLQSVAEFTQDENSYIPKARPAKRKITKKRKVAMDSAIEMTAQQSKKLLSNTDAITTMETFGPFTKFQRDLSIAKADGFKSYSGLSISKAAPKFFSRHIGARQRVSKLFFGAGIISGEAFEESLQLPNVAEDNSLMFNDDFGDAPDISVFDFAVPELDQSASKRAKIDFNESIVFGDDILGADLSMSLAYEPETTPEVAKIESDKTLQILKESCNASESKSITFRDFVETSTRAQTAKLFFEILVLKSMDVVKVEQSVPFGDIEITMAAASSTA